MGDVQDRVLAAAVVLEHLGLEVVARVAVAPEVDADLLVLPGKAGGNLGSLRVGDGHVAAQVVHDDRREGAQVRQEYGEPLPVGDLPGRLEAEGVLGLVELDALSEVEQLGHEADRLGVVLLVQRPVTGDHAADGSVEEADGPEQRRRVLDAALDGHPAQEVDLAEAEPGFPPLEIELHPGKAATARAAQDSHEYDQACDGDRCHNEHDSHGYIIELPVASP